MTKTNKMRHQIKINPKVGDAKIQEQYEGVYNQRDNNMKPYQKHDFLWYEENSSYYMVRAE